LAGAKTGLYGVSVLISAWALSRVCKDLGTASLLTALLGDTSWPNMIPLATFCAAALVAFATGTSWGTMAILIPTALPLAHAVGGGVLLTLTIAAVLDGAIFGDHCSPISDTTLMSSIGAGSDHVDHVVTQLPYAVSCMLVALGCGYLLVAIGVATPLAYLIGGMSLLGLLLCFGRRSSA
jgi:Na+/H+ antiporter NhaC